MKRSLPSVRMGSLSERAAKQRGQAIGGSGARLSPFLGIRTADTGQRTCPVSAPFSLMTHLAVLPSLSHRYNAPVIISEAKEGTEHGDRGPRARC
jgi:hypothetical protein